MAEQQEKLDQNKSRTAGNKASLKSFFDDRELMVDDDEIMTSKPIADLFPETTILFCDLVGFTAWSSMREPTAVFILLETLYG